MAEKVWTAVVFSLIDLMLVASPALPEGPVTRAASSIVTVAEPSVIWAGTLSDPDALSVNENVSLLSTELSSVVDIENVLDDSPAAKEIVVLIAV